MSNTYQKAGGSAGSKGVDFQIDLLSIFLLNALQSVKDWKLSTENKLAGKFDDVVLELSDGSAILLQAKHKESKKITLDQFLSTNPKNDDFSLPKYFLSYLEIKTKFPVKSIIICTNVQVDVKTKKFLIQNNTCRDSMLNYESAASCFTFSDDILTDLIANAKIYQKTNLRQKDADETVVTEENVKEFLKHLQIHLDYPSGNDLKKVIEKLLSSLTCSGSLLRNISHQDLYQKIKNWFEQPKGEYLTEVRSKAMFCEIKSEKYRLYLEDYKLFFKNNDFTIPNSKMRIFHVVAEEGHLLYLMKIYRSLQQNDNKILYAGNDDGSDVQEEMIKAFELPLYTCLIIVSPTFSELVINELCTKLKDILLARKYKTVVFVAELNNKLAQRMKSVGIDYDTIRNIPTLDDLSEETQVKLLKTKNIVFQGEEVSLTELFPEHITEDHKKSIKPKILEKLVKDEKIKVGIKLTDIEEDVSRYYIDRKLNKIESENDSGKERKHTISEENIYNVTEKIVLISDGAGAGKTTVLKNLALTIKKAYPHFWVIRVELNDCTKVLRDSLRQRKPISVHELLSSKDTTKLTNELETILFSLKGMVVLLLDGVDEIIPGYKTLIMNLLLETQKAENLRKLFVTTRPHMEHELVRELKVTSFTLVPLTQQNQINFFINYWSHTLELEGENKSKCERYAIALINKISLLTGNWYGDVKFVSSPLHARMLAEVFLGSSSSGKWKGCKEYLSEDEVEPRLENVSMAKLYEMFIDKKEDIFLDKGNPSGNETANEALTDQFEECMTYHRSLALEVILDATKYTLFSCYQSYVGDKEITMLKMGMVQKLDNKYRFAHRTFAEYFVAESILKELQLQNTNTEFQKFLIDEVFVNQEYTIVCHFLDNLLQNNMPPLSSGIFKSYMSCVNGTKNSNLIHRLAADGNTEIIRFILKCIDFKITTKNKEEGEKEISELSVDYRTSVTTTTNTLNVLKYLVGLYGIDIRGNKDRTPLHNAVLAGHLDTVKFLVETGADINRRSRLKDTALHFAASSGNTDIVEFLVNRIQDVNITNFKNYTPLHFAVMNSNIDTVELLQKHGADLNIGTVDGNTALHFAVEKTELNILKSLIEHNADIDSKNIEGYTALHYAAGKGSFDAVEFLVEHAANINIANKKGYTAIHFAVKENSFDIIEFLVKRGANINISTKEGYTALHFAVQRGSLDIVCFLIRHGVNINFKTKEGYTALHFAANDCNFDIVKLLIKQDADVNTANRKGYTALHLTAGRGCLYVVEFLVKNNAAVNVADLEGYTALHFAAGSNNLDIVKLLVGLNPDINVKTQEGYTPLHFAIRKCNFDIVKFLVNHDADINIETEESYTALHFAAEKGNSDIVEFLVKHNANVNIMNKEGYTASHIAAEKGYFGIVKLLLKHDANINIANKEGYTLLHFAAEKNSTDIVEFLIKHDADINITNKDGYTALSVATKRGNFDIVKLLVTYKVNTDIANAEGYTALHFAAQKGRFDIVEFLVIHGANINIKTKKKNYTALHFVTKKCKKLDSFNIIKFLVTHGADINIGKKIGYTPLHIAANRGSFDIVKFLISNNPDINVTDVKGCTALHYATKWDCFDMVQFLVQHGANIYSVNKKGYTVLHLAVENCNFDMVTFFIQHKANPNIRTKEGYTALHLAAKKHSFNILQFLVKHDADVNIANNDGQTALHFAAGSNNCDTGIGFFVNRSEKIQTMIGSLNVIEFLMKHKIDVNVADKKGYTALHLATQKANLDVVEYLVKHAADVNIANKEGYTALHFAAVRGSLHIIKFLMTHDVGVNVATKEGYTALHFAVKRGILNIVKFFVEHNANINMANKEGCTALHFAADSDSCDIVNFLIMHNVELNLTNQEGNTPLHVATNKGNRSIVESLVKHGADINIANKEGCTALHFAAERGNFHFIKILVEYGADINIANKEGYTVLHFAAKGGNLGTVAFFVEHDVNINIANKEGCTALHLAVEAGVFNIVELLVKRGCDVNIVNRKGYSALDIAMETARSDIVEFLKNQS